MKSISNKQFYGMLVVLTVLLTSSISIGTAYFGNRQFEPEQENRISFKSNHDIPPEAESEINMHYFGISTQIRNRSLYRNYTFW